MVLCCGAAISARERTSDETALKAQPGFTPPLTLLKPVHGYEPQLETHLASFFEQDYPEYEILFCARSETDEGLEIARRVAARVSTDPDPISLRRAESRLTSMPKSLRWNRWRLPRRTTFL